MAWTLLGWGWGGGFGVQRCSLGFRDGFLGQGWGLGITAGSRVPSCPQGFIQWMLQDRQTDCSPSQPPLYRLHEHGMNMQGLMPSQHFYYYFRELAPQPWLGGGLVVARPSFPCADQPRSPSGRDQQYRGKRGPCIWSLCWPGPMGWDPPPKGCHVFTLENTFFLPIHIRSR